MLRRSKVWVDILIILNMEKRAKSGVSRIKKILGFSRLFRIILFHRVNESQKLVV
jgi:hypothetical protein